MDSDVIIFYMIIILTITLIVMLYLTIPWYKRNYSIPPPLKGYNL